MAHRPMNKMMYLLLILVIVSFLNTLSMDTISEETTLNPMFVKAREDYVEKLRSTLKMAEVNDTVLESAEKFISEIETGVKRDNTIKQLQYYSDDEFFEKQTQDDIFERLIGKGIDDITKILNFDQNVDFAAFVKAKEAADIGTIIIFLKSHENINIQKINEGLDQYFKIDQIATLLEFDQDVDFVAFAKHTNAVNIDKIISILKSNKDIKIQKINEGLDKYFKIDQIATLLEFDQDVDFVAFAKHTKHTNAVNIDKIISILKSNKNIKIQKINEGLDKYFKIDQIEKILEFDQDVDFAAFAKHKYNVNFDEINKILENNKNIKMQKINEGLDNRFTIHEIKKILDIKNDVDFTELAVKKKANGGDVDIIIKMWNNKI